MKSKNTFLLFDISISEYSVSLDLLKNKNIKCLNIIMCMFLPNFTIIHLHHVSVVALNGIVWHCLAKYTWHAGTRTLRAKNLPESNHPQTNGGEKKVHMVCQNSDPEYLGEMHRTSPLVQPYNQPLYYGSKGQVPSSVFPLSGWKTCFSPQSWVRCREARLVRPGKELQTNN